MGTAGDKAGRIEERQSVANNCLTKHFTGSEQSLDKLLCMVDQFGEALGLVPRDLFKIRLALDELVTNILSYGCKETCPANIFVRVCLDRDVLSIRLQDDARPFNPLEAPSPELDLPLEERIKPIGGMGIHIVKGIMDSIDYLRVEGKNQLTLTKKISQPTTKTASNNTRKSG